MRNADSNRDPGDTAPQQRPIPDSEHTASEGIDAHGYNAQIAKLFEAHNRALLRFLACRLHSQQEAKEVAQEAYVRMLQLDAPGGIGYLRAFLFKTAANLAADRMKSAARRGRVDQLEFFDETDCEPSPEAGVGAQQELTAILRICEELPARCRYAFIMHRFYGHSVAEIAGVMNLSARMVQLYVERALVFCRDRLNGEPASLSGGRHD